MVQVSAKKASLFCDLYITILLLLLHANTDAGYSKKAKGKVEFKYSNIIDRNKVHSGYNVFYTYTDTFLERECMY